MNYRKIFLKSLYVWAVLMDLIKLPFMLFLLPITEDWKVYRRLLIKSILIVRGLNENP